MIWFTAAILLIQGFTLFAVSSLGRHLMATQEQIDALTVQIRRGTGEVLSKLADVQAQLEDANVADQVDISELVAAAQALDDIVPDAPEVVEELPSEVPAE